MYKGSITAAGKDLEEYPRVANDQEKSEVFHIYSGDIFRIHVDQGSAPDLRPGPGTSMNSALDNKACTLLIPPVQCLRLPD